MSEDKPITVGELRKILLEYPDDFELRACIDYDVRNIDRRVYDVLARFETRMLALVIG